MTRNDSFGKIQSEKKVENNTDENFSDDSADHILKFWFRGWSEDAEIPPQNWQMFWGFDRVGGFGAGPTHSDTSGCPDAFDEHMKKNFNFEFNKAAEYARRDPRSHPWICGTEKQQLALIIVW